jgi:hypothetical protein
MGETPDLTGPRDNSIAPPRPFRRKVAFSPRWRIFDPEEDCAMYIDPTSKIAGLPALRVKSFFKGAGDGDWPIEKLAEAFSLEVSTATTIARELVRNGLVEDSARTGKPGHYRVTLSGKRLALATAARPLMRQTADRVLERFLDRVRAVNADPYHVYRVQQVRTFGSYLTHHDRLNAIDVVVTLAPRHRNPDRQAEQMRMRAQEARHTGRSSGDPAEEAIRSRKEVMLFLKSQSRAIVIHDAEEDVLRNAKTETIFDAATS